MVDAPASAQSLSWAQSPVRVGSQTPAHKGGKVDAAHPPLGAGHSLFTWQPPAPPSLVMTLPSAFVLPSIPPALASVVVTDASLVPLDDVDELPQAASTTRNERHARASGRRRRWLTLRTYRIRRTVAQSVDASPTGAEQWNAPDGTLSAQAVAWEHCPLPWQEAASQFPVPASIEPHAQQTGAQS
jgi:hypothetical protein